MHSNARDIGVKVGDILDAVFNEEFGNLQGWRMAQVIDVLLEGHAQKKHLSAL